MSLIQIIILVIVLIVWWRLYARLKSDELTLREFVEWFLLWLMAAVVVLVPEAASYLAFQVGVGRGSDLVTYLALLLVFYLIFKLFLRLEKFERQLTAIVRELTLKDARRNSPLANKTSSEQRVASNE